MIKAWREIDVYGNSDLYTSEEDLRKFSVCDSKREEGYFMTKEDIQKLWDAGYRLGEHDSTKRALSQNGFDGGFRVGSEQGFGEVWKRIITGEWRKV